MDQLYTNNMLQERHHQIFIEQTPTAIAMLDTNMVYLAVSKRWLKDFKLEGQDIVGKSHYDVFPEIGDDWKVKNRECLNGAIDVCDEAPFYRKDGSVQWIYWDVRPWYNQQGEIGGLLMHTGDITEKKEKELQKDRVDSILEDTSEIARIGIWEMNLFTNEIIWSKLIYEIYGVSEDYIPNISSNLDFCTNNESKKLVEAAIVNLMEKGIPVDIEYEIKNGKGEVRFVKVIGKIEYIEGVASRLFGIIQDLTSIKQSEKKLFKAHTELEAIFNSKSIAVVTTDKNGVINRFNSGAEQLLGYTSEELIGKHKPEIYLLKDELEQFRTDMISQFSNDISDKSFNYRNENINDTRQWIYRRKNGSTFPVLSTITAVNNNQGENEGFIAVATDISKIKEVKDELKRKNNLLNHAEQITKMGNWQWKLAKNTVVWSSNLYGIFDIEEGSVELEYDTYLDFVHPEDKDQVLKHIEKFIADREKKGLVHRIQLKDGTVKTLKIIGEVITNAKGEIVEVIGACQDITEAKIAEEKLIAAKEELEIFAQKLSSQNQQLADFTHITSHNLRAPVANLNSLLEIYSYSDDEEERADIFDKFSNVIDHLSSTLNTLIEALKTKVGDANENLEKCDFNNAFENTTEILSGEILKSGATVTGDFSRVSNIDYNSIYLESIFLNLIGNAIKYRSENRSPEINITSEIINGKINLKFQDNGLGIDLKKHGHKLFGLNKIFHRHPDAKGVGLFLTKTQIEAMGGTITAASEVNVGTTFIINF
ncbi:PAS domain S-box protein [Maribacter sp. SA7]|uniref:PAS domain-containing sensor histidine kinase n=1 Tax=Maribacter zhoushanensis TaxID=3030012 RepID=UPI0023ED60FE|nr:PAS domain S-box protein [Maribacter zhoushanensis]MDF4201720.1 PAS domain S-box protein [Maribacter zhoushanensis]